MVFKEKDFLRIDFDIFANGKLVQTSNNEKGKELGNQDRELKPEVIVLGKNFILKALDEDILSSGKIKERRTLELSPEKAYGKRDKNLVKTFPKSAFDEHKLRIVPGMTYDFNGTFGTVKSHTGGRVLVDFNNPLAGKEIRVEYEVLEKVEDIKEQISTIFDSVLRISPEHFKIEEDKDSKLILKVPEQLLPLKEMLIKSLEEFIPKINDSLSGIESFKKN